MANKAPKVSVRKTEQYQTFLPGDEPDLCKIEQEIYYKALEGYRPELDDEILLARGDLIKATYHTDDEDWLIGINQRSGKEGAFCTTICEKMNQKTAIKLRSQKTSINTVNENEEEDIYELNTTILPSQFPPSQNSTNSHSAKRISVMVPKVQSTSKANELKNLPKNSQIQGYWKVIQECKPELEDEHHLKVGEVYEAIENDGENWWFGRLKDTSGPLKAFCTVNMEPYTPAKPRKPSRKKDSKSLKNDSTISSVSYTQMNGSNNSDFAERLMALEAKNAQLEAKVNQMAKNHLELQASVRNLSGQGNLRQEFNELHRKMLEQIQKTQQQVSNSAKSFQDNNADLGPMKTRLEKLKNTAMSQNFKIEDLIKRIKNIELRFSRN